MYSVEVMKDRTPYYVSSAYYVLLQSEDLVFIIVSLGKEGLNEFIV